MITGSRIPKSSFERLVRLDEVAAEFRNSGFMVNSVIRTARAVHVGISLSFEHPRKGIMAFSAEFVIEPDQISLRFLKARPRDYYYLNGTFAPAIRELEQKGTSTWFRMKGGVTSANFNNAA